MSDNDDPRYGGNSQHDQKTSADPYERAVWSIRALPFVIHTKETTMTVTSKEHIGADTFIVQTYRQKDIGDTIFFQHIFGDKARRIVIPPEVADVIARQRDQLTNKNRRKGAIAAVQTRRERGITPNTSGLKAFRAKKKKAGAK